MHPMWESAKTCSYATNCPSFDPPLHHRLPPLSNGSIIHIIFMKVWLDNNIIHAGAACFPKFSCRKVPAFEYVPDEQVSRAGGRVIWIVPWIYMNLLTPQWVPNSSVSKILHRAKNFWEGAGKIRINGYTIPIVLETIHPMWKCAWTCNSQHTASLLHCCWTRDYHHYLIVLEYILYLLRFV